MKILATIIAFAIACGSCHAQSPLVSPDPIGVVQRKLVGIDLTCSREIANYKSTLKQAYDSAVKQQAQDHAAAVAAAKKAGSPPPPEPTPIPLPVPNATILTGYFAERATAYALLAPQIAKLRKGVLAMADSMDAAQLAKDQTRFAAAQAAATAPETIPTTLAAFPASSLKMEPMYRYLDDLRMESSGK